MTPADEDRERFVAEHVWGRHAPAQQQELDKAELLALINGFLADTEHHEAKAKEIGDENAAMLEHDEPTPEHLVGGPAFDKLFEHLDRNKNGKIAQG